MPVDESPVETVNRIAPVAFAVVAHLEQVVRATDVGLGGEDAAVAEQPHAVDVGAHHPFRRIDEHLHEPAVRGLRPNLAQRHQVAEHHQARNVMCPAQRLRRVDRVVQRRNTGGSVVPGTGQLAPVPPEVGGLLGFAVLAVDAAHELAPADDLADEALDALQRCILSRCEHARDNLVGS